MPCNDHIKRELISHATMILLSCGFVSFAAKLLLSAGEYSSAISVCSKALANPRRSRLGKGLEEASCGEGTLAKDFFCAAGKIII